MAHRVFLTEFVEMSIEHAGIQVEVVVQESAKISVTIHRVRDDLDAVAGRDHHTLFDSGIGGQLAAGIGQARFRDRQPLADFERRALMIQTDELVSHEVPNLCIAEK